MFEPSPGVPSAAIADVTICHMFAGAALPVITQPLRPLLKFWFTRENTGSGEVATNGTDSPIHIVVVPEGDTDTTGSGLILTCVVRTQPVAIV
jgi:hypothetical protein